MYRKKRKKKDCVIRFLFRLAAVYDNFFHVFLFSFFLFSLILCFQNADFCLFGFSAKKKRKTNLTNTDKKIDFNSLQVTKNKTWKDIAGLLGIGASSSAAYTLRKHYTKHLLAYECHFDRGGVDPQPIINQVEAGSKKKPSKGTASVPSPGERLKYSNFLKTSVSLFSVIYLT